MRRLCRLPRRMFGVCCFCVAALLVAGPACAGGPAGAPETGLSRAGSLIKRDALRFYDAPNLTWLGVGLAGSAVMANSSLDENFRDSYQEDWRSASSDDLADVVKPLGNGAVTLPVYALALAAGLWKADDASMTGLGRWGEQSLRSTLVGAPALLVLQRAIGSGRPRDGEDSKWDVGHHPNGVSGHAFMGAVPFLVAAGLSEDPFLRAGLFAGSALSGWSRVNDDYHYLSQVLFGWWLAYRSVATVQGDTDERTTEWVPATVGDCPALAWSVRF